MTPKEQNKYSSDSKQDTALKNSKEETVCMKQYARNYTRETALKKQNS